MAPQLEESQVALLADLVEAARKALPERHNFVAFHLMSADPRWPVNHRALGNGYLAYPQDLIVLERAGLLHIDRHPSSMWEFFILPAGYEHYRRIKQEQGAPIERLEGALRGLLNGERFRRRHPAAYQKWTLAEARLLEANTADHLTAIGHHCREAMQEFVSGVVAQHRPLGVDSDPAHTVARLKAVLATRTLGTTLASFCEALTVYWGAVSDLVQRQAHGARKEGARLTIEDGRRVVYQTLNVMYEVDRALD